MGSVVGCGASSHLHALDRWDFTGLKRKRVRVNCRSLGEHDTDRELPDASVGVLAEGHEPGKQEVGCWW